MLTEDDLVADPAVQYLVTKLGIYQSWCQAAVEETLWLRAERDALKDEIRRYVAARVAPYWVE